MTRANSVVAGVGAIGFAVLTFVAIFFVNWPGGGYSESMAKRVKNASEVSATTPATRVNQRNHGASFFFWSGAS